MDVDGMKRPPPAQRTAARVRPVWVAVPLESVGPLRFGMTVEEAGAALPEARELRQFRAEPRFDVVGIELGFAGGEPAVYEYFLSSGGPLFCVAADAIHGPQITLDGTKLTGGNPGELYQWLSNLPDSMGSLRYGPRGNPGVEELGLVLRVQVSVDGPLTRPVLVGRDWAEDCVDDWHSMIPECEFYGRVFPDPRFPDREEVDPPPGYAPRWADKWSPPF
jgi:hypothetical protein